MSFSCTQADVNCSLQLGEDRSDMKTMVWSVVIFFIERHLSYALGVHMLSFNFTNINVSVKFFFVSWPSDQATFISQYSAPSGNLVSKNVGISAW